MISAGDHQPYIAFKWGVFVPVIGIIDTENLMCRAVIACDFGDIRCSATKRLTEYGILLQSQVFGEGALHSLRGHRFRCPSFGDLERNGDGRKTGRSHFLRDLFDLVRRQCTLPYAERIDSTTSMIFSGAIVTITRAPLKFGGNDCTRGLYGVSNGLAIHVKRQAVIILYQRVVVIGDIGTIL